MALQNGEKAAFTGYKAKSSWTLLGLRLVAFLAAAAATLVMALNKQTKTLVVATIGTTPVDVTLTAKFQHTPAFVFFVIANGLVSIHNLVMILVDLFGSKFNYKGLRFAMIAILDMVLLLAFVINFYQVIHIYIIYINMHVCGLVIGGS
ncbi:hypothetical protein PTKIN_Ptkin18bG0015400 [Pterospermum kingtungense]